MLDLALFSRENFPALHRCPCTSACRQFHWNDLILIQNIVLNFLCDRVFSFLNSRYEIYHLIHKKTSALCSPSTVNAKVWEVLFSSRTKTEAIESWPGSISLHTKYPFLPTCEFRSIAPCWQLPPVSLHITDVISFANRSTSRAFQSVLPAAVLSCGFTAVNQLHLAITLTGTVTSTSPITSLLFNTFDQHTCEDSLLPWGLTNVHPMNENSLSAAIFQCTEQKPIISHRHVDLSARSSLSTSSSSTQSWRG